jgi:hypothetical protein
MKRARPDGTEEPGAQDNNEAPRFDYGVIDLRAPLPRRDERNRHASMLLARALQLVSSTELDSEETFGNVFNLLPGEHGAAAARALLSERFVTWELLSEVVPDAGVAEQELAQALFSTIKHDTSTASSSELLKAYKIPPQPLKAAKRLFRAWALCRYRPQLVPAAFDTWCLSARPETLVADLADLGNFEFHGSKFILLGSMDHTPSSWRDPRQPAHFFQSVQLVPCDSSRNTGTSLCFPTAVGRASDTGSQIKQCVLNCALVLLEARTRRNIRFVFSCDLKALQTASGKSYDAQFLEGPDGSVVISESFPFTWDECFYDVLHLFLRLLGLLFTLVFCSLVPKARSSGDDQTISYLIRLFESCGGKVLLDGAKPHAKVSPSPSLLYCCGGLAPFTFRLHCEGVSTATHNNAAQHVNTQPQHSATHSFVTLLVKQRALVYQLPKHNRAPHQPQKKNKVALDPNPLTFDET